MSPHVLTEWSTVDVQYVWLRDDGASFVFAVRTANQFDRSSNRCPAAGVNGQLAAGVDIFQITFQA
jgi:hypothetical protein